MGGVDIIHCIGDSHASFFSGFDAIQPGYPERSSNKYPFFRGYRLGSVLAYSLTNLNTKEKGRERLLDIIGQLPKGATILMCFGEIDCRCHLLKQADLQNKSLPEIIDLCVHRYFQVIDELIGLGFRLMVWNVIPSANSNNIEYPTYGSMEERNRCSMMFNAVVKQECEKRGLVFLSIFDKLIKGNLQSRTVYFFDGLHLGQMAMPMVLKKFYQIEPDLIKKHYSLYEIRKQIVIARGRWLYMSVKQYLSIRQNFRFFLKWLADSFQRIKKENHSNI